MIETSNVLVEYRQPIGRSESFSTIDSSVAAAEVIQQQAELKNSLAEKSIIPSTNPIKMEFKNSNNIHLGHKVINIDYSDMNNVEQIPFPKRNDSFSTVASSAAARDIINQYDQLRKNFPRSLDDTGSKHTAINLRFKNALGVHVGKILYHIHHYTEFGRKNSFMSHITDLVSRLKPSSSFEVKASKKNIILLIVMVVVALLTSVGLVTYFIVRRNNDSRTSGSTPKRPNSTVTSTEIPPLEIPKYLMLRDKWGADEPKSNSIPKLNLPIKRIIIGQTGGEFCETEADCARIVKSIQSQDSSLDDIAYNFLIGGDENVYEGRGFEYQGQHTENKDATEFNSIGICIAFIGNYQSTSPNADQIELLQTFIEYFKDHNLIDHHYKIFLQDDLKYSNIKAKELNEAVGRLKNYHALDKIVRREEWRALAARDVPDKFSALPDNLTLSETLGNICYDLDDCIPRLLEIQQSSFDKGMIDIEYNFVFSANGDVFEGRGWDYQGDYSSSNVNAIRLASVGDYSPLMLPGVNLTDRAIKFAEDAYNLGKLAENIEFSGIL